MPLYHFLLSTLMLLVFYCDFTSYRIPNWLNLSVLLLYPLFVLTIGGIDWVEGLYGFAAVFTGGFLLFAFRIAGGGDIKLLSALALWCGWGETLLSFILWTAVAGGMFGLALLLARPIAPWVAMKLGQDRVPRVFTHNEPLPYGLAIAGVFLVLLWMGEIPGLPERWDTVLQQF